MAGDDHGALRLVDQLRRLLDLRRMSGHVGVVAGQVDGLGIGELDLFLLHVFGNVDENRSGAPRPRDVEGFLDGAREVGGVHDEVVVLGHGQGDAGDVGLLEGVLADGLAGDLAGDGHHGHGVHHGVGQAGDEVGRPRAGGGPAHADVAGGARVAVGGVGGRLLVPYQNVAKSGVLGEGLVEREESLRRAARRWYRRPLSRAPRKRSGSLCVSSLPSIRPYRFRRPQDAKNPSLLGTGFSSRGTTLVPSDLFPPRALASGCNGPPAVLRTREAGFRPDAPGRVRGSVLPARTARRLSPSPEAPYYFPSQRFA